MSSFCMGKFTSAVVGWAVQSWLFVRVIHSNGVVPKNTNSYFLDKSKTHYAHPTTDSGYDGLISSSSYLHLTFLCKDLRKTLNKSFCREQKQIKVI